MIINPNIQIPAMTMGKIRPLIEALYNKGAPLSKAQLAHKLSTTTTSSRFKQRLISARYYGFIVVTGANAELTERGERFAENNILAMQEGFLSSSFGKILQELLKTRGARIEASEVEACLVKTRNMSTSSDKELVGVFYTVAEEARLRSGNEFDEEQIGRVTLKVDSADSNKNNDITRKATAINDELGLDKPPIKPKGTMVEIPITDGFSLNCRNDLLFELIASPKFAQALKSIKDVILTIKEGK